MKHLECFLRPFYGTIFHLTYSIGHNIMSLSRYFVLKNNKGLAKGHIQNTIIL